MAAEPNLCQQLESAMIQSAITANRRFLPNNAVKQLVTRSSVYAALDLDTPMDGTDDELVVFAVDAAPKMLLLHLLCVKDQPYPEDLRTTLEVFRKHELEDTCLPLTLTTNCSACTQQSSRGRLLPRSCLRSARTVDYVQPLGSCLRQALGWDGGRVKQFVEYQWSLQAPVFTTDTFIHKLGPHDIVPLYGRKCDEKEGHFSKVFRAKLRNEHQIVLRTEPALESIDVAVKQMKPAAAKITTELRDAWEIEAKNCEELGTLEHEHVIRPIAAFEQDNSATGQDNDYYIIFDWAEAGTLYDYWHTVNIQPELTPELVQAILGQLWGVADAINKFHRDTTVTSLNVPKAKPVTNAIPPTTTSSIPDLILNDSEGSQGAPVEDASAEMNWRHGDIKSTNIFIKRGEGPGMSGLGTLVLGDLGLAKKHNRATMHRPKPSTRDYGTLEYEPPEAITGRGRPKSRQYDIWSMGCIVLEFVIWLLHGQRGLKQFYAHENPILGQTLYYQTTDPDHRVAKVSDVAKSWLRHLLDNDPECTGTTESSAVRDLLHLVKDGLLVVALPDSSQDATFGPTRMKSGDMLRRLSEIQERANTTRGYAYTGKSRAKVQLPPEVVKGKSPKDPTAGTAVPRRDTYSREPLTNDWRFASTDSDNPAQRRILETQSEDGVGLQRFFPPLATNICTKCATLDFWAASLRLTRPMNELKKRSGHCQVCEVLYHGCVRLGLTISDTTSFVQEESFLHVNGLQRPAFTICIAPDHNSDPLVAPLQHYLPLVTADPDTASHYNLIKGLLKECDDQHPDCQLDASIRSELSLPKRLIEVSAGDTATIRLINVRGNSSMSLRKDLKYIAISHRWADTSQYKSASTTDKNYHQHLDSIDMQDLPWTFRNAVTVARALGIGYVWIDSLCIIQGDQGEFQEESRTMGSIYSNAYCTLSAIAASNSTEPFLRPRQQRKAVTIGGPPGSDESLRAVCLCVATDDFQTDVLEAPLNRRGWVLQEHALARRTIFYTDTQVYFECGQGVRCETLARITNKQAEFLGDPNFPKLWEKSTRGQAISFYESVFRQYSRLELSRITDRPFAITALERRLVQALSNTGGGFCVFQTYLGRSLLWCRGTDESELPKIDFPAVIKCDIPSWSWLCVKGGIDFVPVPDGKLSWSTEIVTPAAWGGKRDASATVDRRGEIKIYTKGRPFTISDETKDVLFIYDRPSELRKDTIRCVVLGELKDGAEDGGTRCYVLYVEPSHANLQMPWERVGAGFLPRKCIAWDDMLSIVLQ